MWVERLADEWVATSSPMFATEWPDFLKFSIGPFLTIFFSGFPASGWTRNFCLDYIELLKVCFIIVTVNISKEIIFHKTLFLQPIFVNIAKDIIFHKTLFFSPYIYVIFLSFLASFGHPLLLRSFTRLSNIYQVQESQNSLATL